MKNRVIQICPISQETIAMYKNKDDSLFSISVECWALLETGEVVGLVRNNNGLVNAQTSLVDENDFTIKREFYRYGHPVKEDRSVDMQKALQSIGQFNIPKIPKQILPE